MTPELEGRLARFAHLEGCVLTGKATPEEIAVYWRDKPEIEQLIHELPVPVDPGSMYQEVERISARILTLV